jgi:hypothetical protein
VIIGGKQNHRETDVAVSLELLNYCASAIGLLVQDDRFKPYSLKKASNRNFGDLVVSVDDKDLALDRLLWRGSRFQRRGCTRAF